MQGPEGRPPNVSPARKGWEIDPEEDPSAVGAALNRSSALLCHYERTRISYFTALTSATYVVLPKENHMQLTEAATLNRKSGEADLSRRAVEGSAVPRTSPGNAEYDAQIELSSRPKRSEVEGSAVRPSVLPNSP